MKWPVHPARCQPATGPLWAQHTTEFMNCEFLTAMGEAGRPDGQNKPRRSGAKVTGVEDLFSPQDALS